MSEENVEVVKRAIDVLNEQDVERYLALCAPDVELISPLAQIEGAITGAEGIRQFFAGLDEAASEFRLDVERLQELGKDQVLALVQVSIVSQGGFRYAHPAANVYDLVDGKLRRVHVYLDRDEALEAVGLWE